MKGMMGWAIAATTLLGIGTAMAVTNPGDDSYNVYATEKLTNYLTDNVCPKTPDLLGINLGKDCGRLLQQNQEQIRTVISTNTNRQNYGVLSLYETNLSPDRVLPPDITQLLPPGLLPSYRFETISLFGQHYTFRAERQ